jgi:septal ring factor EnvC (AmiA/AmiB activator)
MSASSIDFKKVSQAEKNKDGIEMILAELEEIKNQIARIDEKAGDHAKELALVDGKIKKIDAEFKKVGAKFKKVDKNFNTINKKNAYLEGELLNLEEKNSVFDKYKVVAEFATIFKSKKDKNTPIKMLLKEDVIKGCIDKDKSWIKTDMGFIKTSQLKKL